MAVVCAAALSPLSACGTLEPPGVAARIEVLTGDNQVGQVALTLPVPLRVLVLDAEGRPLEGVPVRFEVVEGEGRLGVSRRPRVSLLTGPEGRAEVVWTLGPKVGLQRVSATAPPLGPVMFEAVAGPGAAASVAPVSGDGQRGAVGERLPQPLAVAVRDDLGNAVPGVTVVWEVASGAAELSTEAVATDSAGRAAVSLTPGAVGEITVTAVVETLAPAVFTSVGQARIVDPAGDGFDTQASLHSTPPDLVEVKAWVEGGDLQIKMWFTDFPEPGVWGGAGALAGYVDIDADQDPATGAVPFTDRLRPGAGSTGLGAEFSVALFTTTGRFDVMDAAGVRVGTVRSRFAGNTVRMWIPLALIRDDGLVNLAVVAGTRDGPTDIAPDTGNLAMTVAGR
jgi:hypothetical protein